MKPDYRSLANKGISSLTPYQPGKPIEELERELGIKSSIKLASNENPLGPSPKAIEAIRQHASRAHIYPDGACFELKELLAQQLAVDSKQVTVGNGSENILEVICKSYLQAGDSAVISQYAFLTIPILIKSYGASLNVADAVNWGHDVDNMLAAIDDKTRIIFIVNPNNPTGTFTTESDFAKLMDNVPDHIIVVLDEAYSEYITRNDYADSIALLKKYPNLIISRTFSKAYGLAALRLGYAVSSLDIADILNRARLPFNVNSIAAKAGCAALLDQDHILKSVEVNNEGMKQLENGLQSLGLEYIPSLGNFITIDVKNANDVYHKLLLEGVIVRPLAAYNMPRHIRVTVGLQHENERFLLSIQKVLSGLKEIA